MLLLNDTINLSLGILRGDLFRTSKARDLAPNKFRLPHLTRDSARDMLFYIKYLLLGKFELTV